MSLVPSSLQQHFVGGTAQVEAEAINLLKKCVGIFGTEGLCLSFNGGKDCTVVLHLACQALGFEKLREIKVLFWSRSDDFKEIHDFLDVVTDMYSLDVIHMDGDFKSGLTQIVTETSIRAILMGTRKGDPYADLLDPICASDEGWPDFMRINPIINWSHSDVWRYLREDGKEKERPFCSLYANGFTSLGGIKDTLRHPALLIKSEDGKKLKSDKYLPAWELPDCEDERLGRRKVSSS